MRRPTTQPANNHAPTVHIPKITHDVATDSTRPVEFDVLVDFFHSVAAFGIGFALGVLIVRSRPHPEPEMD